MPGFNDFHYRMQIVTRPAIYRLFLTGKTPECKNYRKPKQLGMVHWSYKVMKKNDVI